MGLINWASKQRADEEWEAKKARKERRSPQRIEADKRVQESKTIMEKSSVIFSRILGEEI